MLLRSGVDFFFFRQLPCIRMEVISDFASFRAVIWKETESGICFFDNFFGIEIIIASRNLFSAAYLGT